MDTDITVKQVLSYILTHIKLFPLPILVMLCVACGWAIDVSFRPYLLKLILNRLAENGQSTVFVYLVMPIFLYLGMGLLLSTLFRLYDYFVSLKMIPRMRGNIANDALERLMNQSHSYYQNTFSGSLASKVNDLTGSIPEFIQGVIDRFFSHSLALIIAIFTLWQVNMVFAVSMLVWSTLFIISALLFAGRIARYAGEWSEFGSLVTGKIVDILSNILSVRLFTAKPEERKMFDQTVRSTVAAEQKLQRAYFGMWLLYGYSFFFLQAANVYFLCKGRQEGWITVGDFALVLVINMSIIEFLWHVAKEFAQFTRLYGRIAQALRAILNKPDLFDQENACALVVSKGEIKFSDVKFHYPGTESLFQNKSVTIKAGQRVGLVGYSGGGKSTFVNLILRLYDVTKGCILIDGQDIRHVKQDSLRRNIATIPQDPSLFHRTLMENIRYGYALATDEEVICASKKAHAHEFIRILPQGYESLVGERGVKLSGGQRQRIAIARAILKNAPILILDEATSQLDSMTEREIQDSLWELMKNKTTIVIAHRLSTLLHMDRILVFDQGKIVEDGTHTELLHQGGLYKTLWEAQIGGFLPERKNGKP